MSFVPPLEKKEKKGEGGIQSLTRGQNLGGKRHSLTLRGKGEKKRLNSQQIGKRKRGIIAREGNLLKASPAPFICNHKKEGRGIVLKAVRKGIFLPSKKGRRGVLTHS